MKNVLNSLLILLVGLFISSCLTTETKEYKFTIKKDGSGSGTVKYINIVSQEDEEEDVSFSDFGELLDDWLKGSSFDDENPNFTVVSKDIYEENGVLCGEVNFTFDNLKDAGFLKFDNCDCSPLLYYLGSLSETLDETNGKYHDDSDANFEFPVMSWSGDTKEITFKTIVTDDLSDCHSLLPLYITWKESQ